MNSITDKFERYHFQEQSEGSIQFKIQYSERVYWRRNPITCRLTSHRTARATARLLPFNPFGLSRSRSSHSSDRLYFKGYWLLFPSAWSHCPVRNIANRLSIWHTYIHRPNCFKWWSFWLLFCRCPVRTSTGVWNITKGFSLYTAVLPDKWRGSTSNPYFHTFNIYIVSIRWIIIEFLQF